MKKLELTDRELMLVELCTRLVTCNLLNKEEETIQDFTAGLHNLNVGSFGKKDYKFEDTNDWVSCIQDLHDIIAKIDPVFHQWKIELGDKPYGTGKTTK